MRYTIIGFLIIHSLFLLLSCNPKLSKKTAPSLPKNDLLKEKFKLTAFVIKDHINIRKTPSTNAQVVFTLQDGETVQITENKNGWYHIITAEGQEGWVRSDLIGPRNLSKTAMARALNDSIIPNFSAQLYIDKNHPYQVIYLKFNNIEPASMDSYVKKIVRLYQQKVYPGPVTVHIIKNNSDGFIKDYHFKGIGLAKIELPVLPVGILKTFKINKNSVKLQIVIPKKISKKELLSLARSASQKYGYPITKAEIIVRSALSQKCLLYYLEDAYGEDYYFDRCTPPAS